MTDEARKLPTVTTDDIERIVVSSGVEDDEFATWYDATWDAAQMELLSELRVLATNLMTNQEATPEGILRTLIEAIAGTIVEINERWDLS